MFFGKKKAVEAPIIHANDDDFDTIGGFLFHVMGRVPDPGETYVHGSNEYTILEADKRKILGLNSARLYGIRPIEDEQERNRTYRPVPKDYESRIPTKLKTLLEFPGFTADNMSRFKERYLATGGEPSNTRYGWIRTEV